MNHDPRHDPELEFLRDRELLDIGLLLRSRRLPDPPLDPAFQSTLRRQLRRQHWEMLENSLPWWRRLTSGPALAWGGATVGAVMIAAAVLFALHPGGKSNVLVVSSPLDHVTNVAVVQPMKIQFGQAMDHQSVESALKIEPATEVTYTWQGNTLLVQPAAGQLAPNTQYRVTLGSSASSADGTELGKPTTIVFVTAPPAPAPVASPTPQASGIALGTPAELAPALAGVTAAWSPDSSTIYFAGTDDTLQSVPSAGGSARGLGTQAVSQVAVSPDGNTVAAASSTSLSWRPATGSGPAGALFDVSPLAIGWDGQKLLAASGTGVTDAVGQARGGRVLEFKSGAQQAAFSPDAKHVLYLDTDGKVHLVDIATASDTVWQISTVGLPAWSQDGAEVAFLTLQGIETADPAGGSARVLASLDQLGVRSPDGIALAWSGGDVLAATPAGLIGVNVISRAPVQLATGAINGLAPSPDRQSLAYIQDGALYVAPLQRAGVQDQLLSRSKDVLSSFMSARQAGDAAAAAKFLDGAGQQAYSKAMLVVSGQHHLDRWFSIFTQAHPDGTVTALVRLVLADDGHGVGSSQLDETITLRSGSDGSILVHGVTAGSPRSVDAGPEVLSIEVGDGQLQLQFDSDLDPSSLAGITLADASGNPLELTRSYSKRTVTIDLSSVPSGTMLQLTISPALKDMEGRGAPQALVLPVLVSSSSSSSS